LEHCYLSYVIALAQSFHGHELSACLKYYSNLLTRALIAEAISLLWNVRVPTMTFPTRCILSILIWPTFMRSRENDFKVPAPMSSSHAVISILMKRPKRNISRPHDGLPGEIHTMITVE